MIRHLVENPFIAATGFAALIHSTWSLGTLFAGEQPEGWHLVGWLVPALLIAFALDVGQIVTSHDIRHRGLTPARAITFVVFSAATYYLQWLYIVHHMPALALAGGVSEEAAAAARALRDAALWLIPALLPLSTLLYTLSSDPAPAHPQTPAADPVQRHEHLHVIAPLDRPVAPPPVVESPMRQQLPKPSGASGGRATGATEGLVALTPDGYVATCPACSWRTLKPSDQSARNALIAHQRKHQEFLS